MRSIIKNLPSIVEQGASGDWIYRKWSDGTAECWYWSVTNKTGITKTIFGKTVYEYDYGTIAPPFDFSWIGGVPHAQVTGSVGTNYAYVGYSRINGEGVSCSLISQAQGTQDCRLSVYLFGKWK
jgi:hypothetical protein